MDGLDSDFTRDFRIETNTLYAVGVLLVVIRLIPQIRSRGIKNLHCDDWTSLNTLVWYSLAVLSMHQAIRGYNAIKSNGEDTLSPEQIQSWSNGRIWSTILSQMMLFAVFSCKFTILLTYKRVTQGLTETKVIKGIMIYVAVGFIASQIAFFAECRPFSDYWVVPAPRNHCLSKLPFQIVVGIVNVSSDFIMLSVAIPLIYQLRIPRQQKAVLFVVFGMGISVTALALSVKVLVLGDYVPGFESMSWYFREASLALYVVNLPALLALVRRLCPCINTWGYRQASCASEHEGGIGLSPYSLQFLHKFDPPAETTGIGMSRERAALTQTSV